MAARWPAGRWRARRFRPVVVQQSGDLRRPRRTARRARRPSRRREDGGARAKWRSEDAFEQAALAPLDGRRRFSRRLTAHLRIAKPLLLLCGIDDRPRLGILLPEDQAVHEALVLVSDRAGLAIDLGADVGIDTALAGLGDQRPLRSITRRRLLGGSLLLGTAGQRRRQRLLGLIGRSRLLWTRFAGTRRTQVGIGRHGER